MIRAGKLRQVITYRVKTQTVDEYGGPVETWADFGDPVRAAATPLIGKDLLTSMAAQSESEVKFNHRFVPGITSAMVIVWNGADYEIVGQPADVHGLGREHEVLAKRLGGGA